MRALGGQIEAAFCGLGPYIISAALFTWMACAALGVF